MNSDEILKAELAKALAECERLREENARLRLRVGEDLKGDDQDVERPSLNGDVKAAAVTINSPPKIKVSTLALGKRRSRLIFFASPIQAALARKLASAILTRTMERRYALGLDSYDRLFPSQDTMPKGGYGNLIALPLQRGPREKATAFF